MGREELEGRGEPLDQLEEPLVWRGGKRDRPTHPGVGMARDLEELEGRGDL